MLKDKQKKRKYEYRYQGACNLERTYQAHFTVKVCHLLEILFDKYHSLAVKILCLQALLTCATSCSILGVFYLPAACANLTRDLRNDSLAMRNFIFARQIGECTLIDSIAHVALPPNYIARNLCQISCYAVRHISRLTDPWFILSFLLYIFQHCLWKWMVLANPVVKG